MLWLPNFKACKLDFPVLHESNFAAYFTGSEKSVKCDIKGRKVDKMSVLDPKVDLKLKSKNCRF